MLSRRAGLSATAGLSCSSAKSQHLISSTRCVVEVILQSLTSEKIHFSRASDRVLKNDNALFSL